MHFFAPATPNAGWLAFVCAGLMLWTAFRLVRDAIRLRLGSDTMTSGIILALYHAFALGFIGWRVLQVQLRRNQLSESSVRMLPQSSYALMVYTIITCVTLLMGWGLVSMGDYAMGFHRELYYISVMVAFVCLFNELWYRHGNTSWNDIKSILLMLAVSVLTSGLIQSLQRWRFDARMRRLLNGSSAARQQTRPTDRPST